MSAAPAVRERPILFSTPMVKALLAGTKTQTRRVLREREARLVQDVCGGGVEPVVWWPMDLNEPMPCPYGGVGARLWVRETHGWVSGAGRRLVYAADGAPADRFSGTEIEGMKWAPSIFMRRADSRTTLEITDVRVQRVQEISEEDAIEEGCPGDHAADRDLDAVDEYRRLWDSINGKRSPWESNPWVWAITFRRVA